MPSDRPDPDRLLAQIKQTDALEERGRLHVFFGASAGVGKTYAMLCAAHERIADGIDLVVGVVETHGRSETAKLLEDLPVLPQRRVEYRGRTVMEFDIDAALKRKPQLIIVDELAHTNVEGSRHMKRWQDVAELLESGIDVYTALNVQHLESLNDVVGGITGIRVRETVPDSFFEKADEITLVDLPPDELLERLREGKVYLPEQAQHATKNFFRKGNLIALRELALRRTADRVDSQMRAYRTDRAIKSVWQARERLIVCITPQSEGDKLVRTAARLAADLKADWIAVYVETPKLQRLAPAERERIYAHLRLAEDLGAIAVTLSGTDVVSTLLDYARTQNANKLVVANTQADRWWDPWRHRLVDQLTRQNAGMDTYVVGVDIESVPVQHERQRRPWRLTPYLWATGACTVTTAIAAPLLQVFELANVVMLFLLSVVAVSIRFGRGPGAWSAALSVALFDFFFVPPRFSFQVRDVQYMFTFALMLGVALIIGQLMAKLRFEARVANRRERRAQVLADLSKDLSSALLIEQIIEASDRHLTTTFNANIALILPDRKETLHIGNNREPIASVDLAVAQWVFDHQQAAGAGTHTLASARSHYLPLQAPVRTRGVLALETQSFEFLGSPEEKRLLEACAAQIALALERIHFVAVAQEALVSMEGERLRNSLLSAISHDLRTPLTAMVGMASALADRDPPEATRKELAHAIEQEALQMSELVTNLLEMARMQTRGVALKKDWQSIEEIVGSSVAQRTRELDSHQLKIAIPSDLPLCECDPLLMQRVFVNLIDNALKFTPPDSEIRISASIQSQHFSINVEDNGPGLPLNHESSVFDIFSRGQVESSKPGVGLGLALCKVIIEAHGGTIRAENRAEGGARFEIMLPLGTAPTADETL